MEAIGYAVVGFGILAFALVSARAERSAITPPMAFAAFGFLVGPDVLGLVEFELDTELIHVLAELALILVLFIDASRIHLRLLWREHGLPLRLLGIGLPLTMVLGTLAAALMFDTLTLAEALVLGIVLAPTDAALGQAVVSNPRVPIRIRQALNVESGLNDGIALPFLLIALAMVTAGESAEQDPSYWIGFAAKQIVLGPIVGCAIGWGGAMLLRASSRAQWISGVFMRLSAIGMALLAFAVAELAGGNGFIAAFAAGMMLGNVARAVCPKLHEFGEAEGQLLTLLIFMMFGGLLSTALQPLDWTMVVYALLSLTVVRVLPVALSTIGTRLQPATIVFLGWFGPRGIASILYVLMIVEQAAFPGLQTIAAVSLLTVLFSILLHGVSANAGSEAYGALMQKRAAPGMPELEEVGEMPLRVAGRR